MDSYNFTFLDIAKATREFNKLGSINFLKKYKFNKTYTVIFHIDSRAYPAIPIFAYSYNIRQNNLLNNIKVDDTFLKDELENTTDSIGYYLNKLNIRGFNRSINVNSKLKNFFINLITETDNEFLMEFDINPILNNHFNFNQEIPKNITNIPNRIVHNNKKSSTKCLDSLCNTWISNNSSGFCKHHSKYLGELNLYFNRWNRISKLSWSQLGLETNEIKLIEFIFNKLDHFHLKSAEYWTIFQVIFLMKNTSSKYFTTNIYEELKVYSDAGLNLVLEVGAVYDMLIDLSQVLELYFAKKYIENINSINSLMDKKIKSKDFPRYTNYDLFTNYWNENENIKNNCSYKNSEPCKSRDGKIKKLFKSKEYASLYMRSNQYWYFCDNSSLGFHIATLKNEYEDNILY